MKRNHVDFTPIPTEYKGVVYRSKCEAMFARYLELREFEFFYEPDPSWFGGFEFDFFAYEACVAGPNHHDGNGFYFPFFTCQIIQYKPTRPTRTYIDRFTTHSMKAVDVCQSRFSSTMPIIYYGSVFSEDRGAIFCLPGREHNSEVDWIADLEDEIRATRFDLEVHHG